MPRFSRSSMKASFFHVMVQGINKKFILKNDDEKGYFISIINELKLISNVKVIAYCVMDNHVHLLLNTEKAEDLSSFMHRLNTRYAMYYNKKHDRVGYVFRDRYRSEEIFSEKQFYNCINYIYDNPVKAGICKNVKNYKYSNWFENEEYIIDNFKSNDRFIDIKEEVKTDEEIINQYLKENNISIYNIRENKETLKLMVKNLKDKKVSYRSMELVIGVSRETLRKLNNNC